MLSAFSRTSNRAEDIEIEMGDKDKDNYKN